MSVRELKAVTSRPFLIFQTTVPLGECPGSNLIPPDVIRRSSSEQPVPCFRRKTSFCRLAKQCAVKGAGLQWVQLPPGNWFAPPGNNRSGGEGNRTVGAFGAKGHVGDSVSVQAVTR